MRMYTPNGDPVTIDKNQKETLVEAGWTVKAPEVKEEEVEKDLTPTKVVKDSEVATPKKPTVKRTITKK